VFRVKDLAISVVPKASDIPELQKCLLNTHICIRPTVVCHFPTCHPQSCAVPSCGFVSPVTCQHFASCPVPSFCLPPSACPPGTLCNLPTLCRPLTQCNNPTFCHTPSLCQVPTHQCPAFVSQCPPGTFCNAHTQPFELDPLTPVVNPQVVVINEVADIKVLREELEVVLRRLGEFEQKGLDAETQTPQELAELETKLKEALEEVQARRKADPGKK
jgi:hypothetical protein